MSSSVSLSQFLWEKEKPRARASREARDGVVLGSLGLCTWARGLQAREVDVEAKAVTLVQSLGGGLGAGGEGPGNGARPLP